MDLLENCFSLMARTARLSFSMRVDGEVLRFRGLFLSPIIERGGKLREVMKTGVLG